MDILLLLSSDTLMSRNEMWDVGRKCTETILVHGNILLNVICGNGCESSQYIFDPNPFKKKSTWTPNKDRDLGLELFMQLLKNDILNSKPSKIADNISKSEREALQTLINHTDIVIKPADKGKATVILNTDDYKMSVTAN